VNGAAVLGYPSGEFSVVVSEYERNGSPLGDKHVLEHARVVSVCFRSGTVLPFRFERFSIPRKLYGRRSAPIGGPLACPWLA